MVKKNLLTLKIENIIILKYLIERFYMKKHKTFIVCHDKNIINNCEQSKIFEPLGDYKYLLVGYKHDCNDYDKVIVCNKLKYNLEKYKNLVSFTAWYALAKNNILEDDIDTISLLEYDITVSKNFLEIQNNTFNKHKECFIGYQMYPLNHPIYYSATPYLSSSFKQVYNIDLQKVIESFINNGGKNAWLSSSNYSMNKDLFLKFVDWFYPIADNIKGYELGAHVHERSIRIYSILNNIHNVLLGNILVHQQQKSHKIEALI